MLNLKSRKREKVYVKNSKVNKKIVKAKIESLPYELLTEVLARLASSSSTWLFNAKLSNKIFNKACNDNYVFKNMSVEKSPLISWTRSKTGVAASNFWERCKESGNREALFMQGVVDYFGPERKTKTGHELLEKAVKLGHDGARYVLGIIRLLDEDGVVKKLGVQIISDIIKSNTKLRDCREKLEFIAVRIWLPDRLGRERPKICKTKEKHGRTSMWGCDYEDNIDCNACRCEREVAWFCNLFRI